MRLFFGVPIPSTGILKDLQSNLSSLSRDMKAVKPDLIHITLNFLGEVRISPGDLAESVGSIVPDHDPFGIEIIGSGAFPDWRRPAVLWLSVTEEDKLAAIAGDIFRVLHDDHHIPGEGRPFRSHITVARVRRGGRIDIGKARRFLDSSVEDFREEGYSIPVHGFDLISSELTPHGPIYRVITSFKLE